MRSPVLTARAVLVVSVAVIVLMAGTTVAGAATAPTPSTIFATTDRPTLLEPMRRSTVEFGTKFASQADGTLTGVRFHRGANRRGVHVAHVWTGSGRLLATRAFTPARGRGWQVVHFRRTVGIAAGRSYVVSIMSPTGFHARTPAGFTQSHAQGDVRVPAGGGGMVRFGIGFPRRGPRTTSYWVDPIVLVGDRAPTAVTEPPATDPVVAPNPFAPFPTTPTPVPDPAPTPTPDPTPVPDPDPAPDPDPVPPGPVEQNTTANDPAAGYPDSASSGVPAGVALSTYAGPCSITVAGTVIDGRIVNCNLAIAASGVVIRNSRINGIVRIGNVDADHSFLIEDSELALGANTGTGLGDANYVARRVHVHGGRRSAYCEQNCTIEDSYLHGQYTQASLGLHMSGVRMSQGLVLRHNTVSCDAPRDPLYPESGCSAGLTGYGEIAPVANNLIEGNIFYGSEGGQATFCVRGGASDVSASKPYGDVTRDIRFISNVFVRGATGRCGILGSNAGFDADNPGNVWLHNVWDDGTPVPIR